MRHPGKRFLPLLFGVWLCAPAQAGVLDSSPQGFTLSNEIVTPATPKAAWRALVRDVDRWWPRDHTWYGDEGRLSIDAKAGGCFCERAGKRQVQHMSISRVEPGRQLRMLGGLGPLQGMGLHGTLDWTFESVAAGTRITLRYRIGGYSPDPLDAFAPVVDRVQAQQLGALGRYLDDQAR